jgi:hypothetical protein
VGNKESLGVSRKEHPADTPSALLVVLANLRITVLGRLEKSLSKQQASDPALLDPAEANLLAVGP